MTDEASGYREALKAIADDPNSSYPAVAAALSGLMLDDRLARIEDLLARPPEIEVQVSQAATDDEPAGFTLDGEWFPMNGEGDSLTVAQILGAADLSIATHGLQRIVRGVHDKPTAITCREEIPERELDGARFVSFRIAATNS